MIAAVPFQQVWMVEERLRRAQERTGTRGHILEEYVQVQEDLEAYLNPPCGTVITDRFWETVKYLERRLDDLEVQLLQHAS
jgi:hypothetical protein